MERSRRLLLVGVGALAGAGIGAAVGYWKWQAFSRGPTTDGARPMDPRWVERYDRIQSRVAAAVNGKCVVVFSAYSEDREGLPMDNLDTVPHNGKMRLISESSPFISGRPYSTPILSSPTWLQIAVYANEMIVVTGDEHHKFLEGIAIVRTEGDVATAEFRMGS